jgi:hypothetical protein
VPERDAIIEALENAGRPTGFKALVAALGVKGNPARHAFQRRLQAMIRDGLRTAERLGLEPLAERFRELRAGP